MNRISCEEIVRVDLTALLTSLKHVFMRRQFADNGGPSFLRPGFADGRIVSM